jgi:hypothetical protein
MSVSCVDIDRHLKPEVVPRVEDVTLLDIEQIGPADYSGHQKESCEGVV